MSSDASEEPDPRCDRLCEDMWGLWVGSAIADRQLTITPATVRRIVVELPPGGPIKLLLDPDDDEGNGTVTDACCGHDPISEGLEECAVARTRRGLRSLPTAVAVPAEARAR